MLGLFKLLFEERSLPPDKVENYAAQFSLVVVSVIIDHAKSRLSEEEKRELDSLIATKKFDKAASLVQGKYDNREWEALIDAHVSPVLDSYFEEVLQKA